MAVRDLRLAVERGTEFLRQLRAVDRAGGADIPFGLQLRECLACTPPRAVGDDRDGVGELHHLGIARHAGDDGGIDVLQLPARHRALHDGREDHARDLRVHAVFARAIDLVRRRRRAASACRQRSICPGVLIAGSCVERDLRRIGGDLAIAQRAADSAHA